MMTNFKLKVVLKALNWDIETLAKRLDVNVVELPDAVGYEAMKLGRLYNIVRMSQLAKIPDNMIASMLHHPLNDYSSAIDRRMTMLDFISMDRNPTIEEFIAVSVELWNRDLGIPPDDEESFV